MKEYTTIHNTQIPKDMSTGQWNLKEKYYEKRIKDLKIWSTISILVLFVAVLVSGFFIVKYSGDREAELKNLSKKVDELTEYTDTLTKFGYTVDELEEKANELTDQISEKQSQLDSLTQSINEKQSQLDDMSYDIDLMNKYNYALYDTMGYRNDITLDILKLIDTECTDRDINPDLVLGIIMVESEGHSGATNSYSGAAGLGQFMPDTGEFIANNYLNLSYDHSTTPYDSITNVSMMIEYLSYLYNKYYGDTVSVLMEYSGGNLSYAYEYYAKVINAVGHNVA